MGDRNIDWPSTIWAVVMISACVALFLYVWLS